MLKIYLDNCCYNRPFDDQSQDLIRLETEAKLIIQERIQLGLYSLVWSYILKSENDENFSRDKREAIQAWQYIATEYCPASDEIVLKAKNFLTLGLKHKDAIHLVCAIKHQCDYFITTDKKFLNKKKHFADISIINPIAFILETEDNNENRSCDTC
ncbi:MAG: PIN domain-containing protein [Planctomycetaceae bacterium]|nr:PIN domain-containing protein [Planctomycetaceae bacterium]